MEVAFTYSLEQVLGLKRQLEEQRKLQLAQAEQVRRHQVERLDSLLSLMEDQISAELTPDMIEYRGQYFAAQLNRIENARQTLKSATDVRDVAQASLVRAALERKKFEVHRDAALEKARQAEQTLEQNILDETAVQIFLRQAR